MRENQSKLMSFLAGPIIGGTVGAVVGFLSAEASALVGRGALAKGQDDGLGGLKNFTDSESSLQELVAMAQGAATAGVSGKVGGNPTLTKIYGAARSISKIGKILEDHGPGKPPPSALTVVVARREWEDGLTLLREGISLLYEHPENAAFSPQRATALRTDIEKEVEEVLALLHTSALASTNSV